MDVVGTFDPKTVIPAECRNNGEYTGEGNYTKVGDGVCVGPYEVVTRNGVSRNASSRIPFKMAQGISEFHDDCMCRHLCDYLPDCIGYALRRLGEPYGTTCRLYGPELKVLGKAWEDQGSISDPTVAKRYTGRRIVGSRGPDRNVCFRKAGPEGAAAEKLAAEARGSPGLLQQLKEPRTFDGRRREGRPSGPVVGSSHGGSSFLQLREQEAATETKLAHRLAWQQSQLGKCRIAEAEHLALLRARGCHARRLLRGQNGVIPSECTCDCPICNWWQLPPPDCRLPEEQTEFGPEPPKPPEDLPPTPPPPEPTPPAVPAEIPLPPLPAVGEEFLPTIDPALTAKMGR